MIINHSPCYQTEGDTTNKILNIKVRDIKGKVNSRLYSSEITMKIKPTNQWGSCHTEHDEGHVTHQATNDLLHVVLP